MRPPPWKYYYWCLPWWLRAIICIIYAWLQLRLRLRLRLRVSLYRCIAVSLFSSGPITAASTKKRYSDTTIQRYTEPEPCINYTSYCLQSPRETSVKIFSGGAHIPKNISYKVKMRKVIVFKAPLHQNYSLSMSNRLKYWHAQSDNLFILFYLFIRLCHLNILYVTI